ncbi:MAG: DMT family transporter [Clostridiales bacterium]|nr:DMT family transporter [Clostridiales bacterium]
MRKYPYVGMILLQSILYGFGNPLTKIAYESIAPLTGLVMRFGIAFLLFLVLFGKRIFLQLAKTKISIYLPSSICMAIAYISCNMALELTSATNVGFLMAMPIIFAPILSSFVMKKKYSIKRLPPQILAVVGLYLLCLQNGVLKINMGDVLAIITALAVAGALVFGEKAMKEMDALVLSAVQIGVTFAGSVLGFLLLETKEWSGEISLQALGIILYLAIGCTGIAYLLQNNAVKHLSASSVSMLQCTAPVATAIISYFLIGERMSMVGVIGACVILLALFLENFLEAGSQKKIKNPLDICDTNDNINI